MRDNETMNTVIGGNHGTSQLPLAGAILCCTAIPPEHRAQLTTIGAQMGATIKLDLTSDVTHLIVGNINSAKYRYVAKSRDDVKVLSPEWLEALRSVWMEGDDVDVAMLEKEYRLPTFYGLKICLTGFDNPEQRRNIQETADLNGAEYHGDLTKSVTHLIAAAPVGKKYEHAVQWRMKIVSYEWFEQSLERTMALDEDCFHPTIPAEDQGKGAWERRTNTSPAIGKRTRDAENGQLINPSRRKLRRAASSKMGGQSDALWAGITASGLERPRDEEDDWTENNISKPAIARADARIMLPDEVNTRQEDVHADKDPASDTRRGPSSLILQGKSGIFQGCMIHIYGFDEHKTTILRDHLNSNGAHVISGGDLERFCSNDLKRGYLVVPHDSEVDFASLPAGAENMGRATNWWVERCLHGKSLVDPTDDILSRPFDKLIIDGFDELIVNSTGFTGIDLLHVTKVVALMGAKYDEVLSIKTSVMICNTHAPNTEKIRYATSKRIPAVHATWLWDSLRTGEMQPYTKYLMNTLPDAQLAKEKLRPSYTEVPTAPLSEEDSIKLRQKKKQLARTVSKSGGPQRATLDLATSATPSSTTESSTHQNTSTNYLSLDHDDDGSGSLPLQDINPSVNSPRRPSTSSTGSATKPNSRRSSSSAEPLIKPVVAKLRSKITKQPTPDSVISAPDSVVQKGPEPSAHISENSKEPEKDYSTILSNLLANRKSAPSLVEHADGKRRKHRTLGRATSARSNPSTADDLLSRTSSAHHTLNDEDGEERENKNLYEYQPSQELGWDSPGAARTREQMIRKLGGKVEGTSVAVEGIGVVKDVMPNGGGLGSGRSTRKKRG